MRFCAEYSRDRGEQFFGTAKPINSWLLVEHRGRWEREAADSLPSFARIAAARLKSKFPELRLALIKQDPGSTQPLRVFLALSRDSGSKLFSFSIDRHDDLAGINFFQILETRPIESPLLAVCTHGTHDPCCAKFGNAVYQALRAAGGADVWQMSHLGGCRFAPNVVSLPEGLIYGRVAPADSAQIVEAARRRHIILQILRGRSCYPSPAQAAEYFARSQRNELGPLRLLRTVEETASEWTVHFGYASGIVSVRLSEAYSGIETFKSCSATDCLPRSEFRLIELRGECPALHTRGLQKESHPWHVKAFSRR
jgi:(2Fe-2S) ferredoxin